MGVGPERLVTVGALPPGDQEIDPEVPALRATTLDPVEVLNSE
jgi:hypothetical protein